MARQGFFPTSTMGNKFYVLGDGKSEAGRFVDGDAVSSVGDDGHRPNMKLFSLAVGVQTGGSNATAVMMPDTVLVRAMRC